MNRKAPEQLHAGSHRLPGSLVHQYWTIDDRRLVSGLKEGKDDFERFIEEIETHMLSQ